MALFGKLFEKKQCSICGSEYGTCGHVKGEVYEGQTCAVILKEPVDAYEFSFVAVPAQREAGVMKAMGKTAVLKELAEANGAQAEYRALCKEAELGRRYRKDLEDGVVRLGLALELGVSEPVLRSLTKTAAADDLLALRDALQGRLDESLPITTQLGVFHGKGEEVESGFLI